MIVLLLMACSSDPREGIGVGNPGDADKPKPSATFALAPTEGATAASVDIDTLALRPCDGGAAETVAIGPVDLLAPQGFELPDGLWCELEAELAGPLSVDGDDYTLSLTPERVLLSSADGVDASSGLLIELGAPGWYDPRFGDVSPDDPAHALLADIVATGSAAFLDGDADGVVDDDERDAVAAGPSHPDDPTPPFWAAVGELGDRRTSFDGGRTWTGPVSDGDDINLHLSGVSSALGRVVAVGGWTSYGRALRTFDGVTWEEFGLDVPLYGVAWYQDRWIAVGDRAMLWSWDGAAWEDGDTGSGYFKSIASDDSGRLVTVGLDGVNAWSDDGLDWTENGLLAGTPSLYSVAWGDVFLAVGNDGLALRSADGESWEDVSPPGAGDLRGLTYDGTYFVAADGTAVHRTTNGDSWESTPADVTWLDQGDGQWIGVGDGDALLTSQDGLTWTERSADSGAGALLAIGYRP